MSEHEVDSWTAEAVTDWWQRCRKCKKWRVRAEYIEMYDDHGWWRECLSCSVITLGDLASEGLDYKRLSSETEAPR